MGSSKWSAKRSSNNATEGTGKDNTEPACVAARESRSRNNVVQQQF